jgi:hypothetical protein
MALMSRSRTTVPGADIGSYTSGQLLVTTAMAAAAAAGVRALRAPLLAYVGAVALTRLLFGAHFPIDVLVGVALGHEVGRFTATLLGFGEGVGRSPAAPAVAPESQPALEIQR